MLHAFRLADRHLTRTSSPEPEPKQSAGSNAANEPISAAGWRSIPRARCSTRSTSTAERSPRSISMTSRS